jgi:hypothetical protein
MAHGADHESMGTEVWQGILAGLFFVVVGVSIGSFIAQATSHSGGHDEAAHSTEESASGGGAASGDTEGGDAASDGAGGGETAAE